MKLFLYATIATLTAQAFHGQDPVQPPARPSIKAPAKPSAHGPTHAPVKPRRQAPGAPSSQPQVPSLDMAGPGLPAQPGPPGPPEGGQAPAPLPVPAAVLPQPTPAPAAVPPPPPDPNAPPPKRFNVVATDEGPSTFLPKLAREAGVKVLCLGDMFAPIDMSFKNATFEEVLAGICDLSGIESRKLPDGSYKVGYPSDLLLEANDPNDTTPIEYLFRPRHLDAESLAQVLSASFPEVRCIPGPLHLSPSLDDGTPGSGGMPMGMPMAMPMPMPGIAAGGGNLTSEAVGQIKALGSSATPFKRHAVTLQGPVNRVRHALIMARRMDRGRRQVRINVSMSEMTKNDARNLGINWDFSGSAVTLAELPNAALGTVSGTTGGNPGLRFGTFAHTPASVALQLQAGITKGTIKTLADPSLLVIDGERCFLLLGTKYLYPQQVGVNAQGNPTYNVAQVATGVYLQMAVQIGLDDDVIITVYPQNSYVSGTQNFNNNGYPIIVTREAQTTVRLRSGEMLAIGGLHQGQETRQASQVPWLGSLPLLGSLFGTKNHAKNTDELVIIIQPEILPAESGRVSVIKKVS